MECLNETLPVILYILLIILLIALIILVIRAIRTLDKVNHVVDDVNLKVSKLNGLFQIVDTTTDTITMISDKIINFAASGVNRLLRRKKKEEDKK